MRKILLVSEDETLCRSFMRALKATGALKVERHSDGFNGKQNVVVYIKENNGNIDSWLWGKFRKKALNPLIVIGTEGESSFIGKNPVFKDYSKEHAYIQIPFNLSGLLNTIDKLEPIYDNVTRRLIVEGYSMDYEYKLITHDIKIIKGNKTETLNNLSRVRDFYQSKGDERAKIIDEKIKEICKRDDWEGIALEIQNYLIERLQRKS